MTESGKVATWYDESVSHVCSKLEHPATFYQEFANDKVVSLHTCVLYTAVRLENSGQIFWWGVLPFNQRKRLLEKYTNKKKSAPKRAGSGNNKKKSAIATSNLGSNEITVGSQVCMRKAPMYHSGSIGFTVSGGIPKVGKKIIFNILKLDNF